MSAPYHLDYFHTLIITNPDDTRKPLPKGLLTVDSEFLKKALTHINCALHQFEPLQVLDKVGFVKSGDDAAEITLDALSAYMAYQLNNGGKFLNMKDIADAIQQGMSGQDDGNGP
jgi:hypothetical protein